MMMIGDIRNVDTAKLQDLRKAVTRQGGSPVESIAYVLAALVKFEIDRELERREQDRSELQQAAQVSPPKAKPRE